MKEQDAPTPGGDLELSLLNALWARTKPATVRELYEEVGVPRGIVYTTVAKVLDRLVAKNMVTRRRVGRAYAFRARALKAPTQRALARSLIRQLIGADPQPAVAALLGAMEDISPELLAELAAELAARQERRHGT